MQGAKKLQTYLQLCEFDTVVCQNNDRKMFLLKKEKFLQECLNMAKAMQELFYAIPKK